MHFVIIRTTKGQEAVINLATIESVEKSDRPGENGCTIYCKTGSFDIPESLDSFINSVSADPDSGCSFTYLVEWKKNAEAAAAYHALTGE